MSRTNFGHDIFQQIYPDDGSFIILQPPSAKIDVVLNQEGKFNLEQDPANGKNIIEDGNLPSGINIGWVYDGDFIHLRQDELRLSEGVVLSGDFIQDKFAPLLFETSSYGDPRKKIMVKPKEDMTLATNYMLDIVNNTHADGTPQHSISTVENKQRMTEQDIIMAAQSVGDQIRLLLRSGVASDDAEIIQLNSRLLELKSRLNPNEIVADAIRITEAEEQKRYVDAQEQERKHQAELIDAQDALRVEIAKRRKDEQDRIAAVIAQEKADMAAALKRLRLMRLPLAKYKDAVAKLEELFKRKAKGEIEAIIAEAEEEKGLGSLFPAEPEEEEEEEKEVEGKTPPGSPPRKLSSPVSVIAPADVANNFDASSNKDIQALVVPFQNEITNIVMRKLPEDEKNTAIDVVIAKYMKMAEDIQKAAAEKKEEEEREAELNAEELKKAYKRLDNIQKFLRDIPEYKTEYDESLKEGGKAVKDYTGKEKMRDLIREINTIAEKYEPIKAKIEEEEEKKEINADDVENATLAYKKLKNPDKIIEFYKSGLNFNEIFEKMMKAKVAKGPKAITAAEQWRVNTMMTYVDVHKGKFDEDDFKNYWDDTQKKLLTSTGSVYKSNNKDALVNVRKRMEMELAPVSP